MKLIFTLIVAFLLAVCVQAAEPIAMRSTNGFAFTPRLLNPTLTNARIATAIAGVGLTGAWDATNLNEVIMSAHPFIVRQASGVQNLNVSFNSSLVTVADLVATSLDSADGSLILQLNANNLSAGTVPTARLGSGVADATTFLRGDQTYAVPAGGSGVTSNSAFTNITVWTADNDPTVTSPAITLKPLESKTIPGGAAKYIEIDPPYNPAWFSGKWKHVVGVVTNSQGDTNVDLIWQHGYNIPGYGTVDTNQPSLSQVFESAWQNIPNFTQLERYDTITTPSVSSALGGTGTTFRPFGYNVVWSTDNKVYQSSDGGFNLGSWYIANPANPLGLSGVSWAAASTASRSYNQTLRGTLVTLTNDVGNGGVDIQGGTFQLSAPSGSASPDLQFISDWANTLGSGSRGLTMYLNAHHASSFYYGLPTGTWSNNVFATNVTTRGGFIGQIRSGEVTNAAGSRVAYLSDVTGGASTTNVVNTITTDINAIQNEAGTTFVNVNASGNDSVNIAATISTVTASSSATITAPNITLDGTVGSTGDVSVPDEAYGVGWNGSVEVPTKNALYDKIETIVGGSSTNNFFGQEANFVTDFGAVPGNAAANFTAWQNFTNWVGTNYSYSRTLFVPPGVYLFTNAVDVNNNAQLVIPLGVSQVRWSRINIRGPIGPAFWEGSNTTGTHPTNDLAIFRTSLTGNANFIASDQWTNATIAGTSYQTVGFENFVIQTPDASQMTGLNLANAVDVDLVNVSVQTLSAVGSLASAPLSNSTGIYLSRKDMGNMMRVDNVNVSGYFYGVIASEHLTAPFLNIVGCANGLVLDAGNTGNNLGRVTLQSCTTNIIIRGDTLANGTFYIERGNYAPSNFKSNIVDVMDFSNQWSGKADFIVRDNGNATRNGTLRRYGMEKVDWGLITTGTGRRRVSSGVGLALELRGSQFLSVNDSIAESGPNSMKSHGTTAAMTAAQAGSGAPYLFSFYDGTDFISGARIRANLEANASGGNARTSLEFHTGTNSSTQLKRFTIADTGEITAGKSINPTNGILWQGGAQLTNIYTATATLDFGNVATIGCADLTMTVTGAALGDVVDLGVPDASVVANSSFSAWVSAADTVTVRFCALISGDPASGVFRAEVHKWR